MVAVGEGAHRRVTEQIRSLGANLLMVQPGAVRESGARLELGSRHTLTEVDAAAIRREIAAVEVASPSIRGTAQIVHGDRNWNTVVNGTEPDYVLAREWPVAAGRFFTAQEVGSAAKVAVLGETVARALFDGTDPVGTSIRIGDTPVTVIGLLRPKGHSGLGQDQDDVVFLPISAARLRLFGDTRAINPGSVNYILVKVVSADAMAEGERQIGELLRQRHRLWGEAGHDFVVQNPATAMAAQTAATRTLTLLLAAIASVSLIVGGIGIMYIMLVSVTERTREIGLRLAVGARRRDIRAQFLVEAISLCLCGGVVGIVTGVAAAFLIAGIAAWPIFVGPVAIGLAAGFAGIVGIFFGYYPAFRASQLDPIEALRSE